MPQKSKSQQTGDIGVSRVGLIVRETMGWEFREQGSDFGIDAHIEMIDAGEVTGKLIGVQIKSGPSFFKKQEEDGFIFSEDLDKLDYWTRYSLPVIVVLYNPESKVAYWAHVDREKIETTGERWKLVVPRQNVLNAQSARALRQLAEGPAWVQKMRRLSLAKPLMMLLSTGGTVQIKGIVSTNKVVPRVSLSIIGKDSGGADRYGEEWMALWPGGWPSELVTRVFPWAENRSEVEGVDDEDALREELYEEIWDSNYGHYAEGEMFGHLNELSDVRDEFSDYDYDDLLAEVRNIEGFSFTSTLELNEVGKAFLTLEDFLAATEH